MSRTEPSERLRKRAAVAQALGENRNIVGVASRSIHFDVDIVGPVGTWQLAQL
jgi:hypothetical protein